ncbi:transcriptional regulator [Methanotorris formicicus]|uniref:Transcriptional regulator, XRE family n=1 Tax=Methanotorris formicicus Mc-S-70 TaxID=647171 RepID=H1KW40_9EURY|nr:hypothetical protein [Methanotorris formicicus]EHP89623.1 transcriptional regulator, XRE family [Methanotorris formicicus Mc-S-70]
MKTRCEVMASRVIPMIRGEIARELVNRGYAKKEVAEFLGVTIAAVSQYTSEKRGATTSKRLKELVKEIVDDIENGKVSKGNLNDRFCKICSIIRKESLDI